MPELPDVTVYVERLAALVAGAELTAVRLKSPFLLRSVEPPLRAAHGSRVTAVRRLGKRIVIGLRPGAAIDTAGKAAGDAARSSGGATGEASGGDLFLMLHLMIAGRLRWKAPGAGVPGRVGLAAFDFARDGRPLGTLLLTEAGTKRRASLHVVAGAAGLAAFDRGGLEVLDADRAAFAAALARENHTLKRALTDPRLFSGIGNAYSDEILHRARLSPFRQTAQLDAGEAARLHDAARAVLAEWTASLRAEAEAAAAAGALLPERVTAFRPGMAVHGRHGQPCPDCGAPVQRIRYAENECNYCARCQTGGRLLADRVLSRLLKDDWPATLEELEELKGLKKGGAANT